MDSFPYSKTAKYVDEDDEPEWTDDDSVSDSDSEWSESESESESESDYATDDELDEWDPGFVSSIQVEPFTSIVQRSEPKLDIILQRIAELKGKYYRSILDEFHSVCRWYKGDHDAVAEFFLPTAKKYDLEDFKHIYLFRKLVDHVTYKQPRVREYLDTIEDVLPLGIVRVKRGTTTYYRIRTGLTSHN